jgi:hypothetical protein
LFFSQLLTELGQLAAFLTVLARRVSTTLKGATLSKTAIAFQKKLLILTTAESTYGTMI